MNTLICIHFALGPTRQQTSKQTRLAFSLNTHILSARRELQWSLWESVEAIEDDQRGLHVHVEALLEGEVKRA